ncbi:hypothetical protein K7G98_12160 [Saccharothrix sp. MB29]|nr:hypothetical protein [Saccharothrix sp. MB29]
MHATRRHGRRDLPRSPPARARSAASAGSSASAPGPPRPGPGPPPRTRPPGRRPAPGVLAVPVRPVARTSRAEAPASRAPSAAQSRSGRSGGTRWTLTRRAPARSRNQPAIRAGSGRSSSARDAPSVSDTGTSTPNA